MIETETKTVKRFVDGGAGSDSLQPIGVTKGMLQTFFDKDACQATSKERASLFQEVSDKTLRATEVVVRPNAAKKAEELAKQADIRNSFLMSAASRDDGASNTEESATSKLQPPLPPPDALEAELEKLMDEEEEIGVGHDDGLAPASGVKSTAKAPLPVPVPVPKTSTPKAKAKQQATKETKSATTKNPSTSSRAKTPSKANNFSGQKKENKSRGDNFKKK